MYKNQLVVPNTELEGVADPHFLRYNGRYYLYPTGPVKAWESEDLVNWKYNGVVTVNDDLFVGGWGPHVKYWNGSFYMYVNSPGAGEGHHQQYVLRADSPTGPFTRQTGNLGVRLAPTVFVDDDGSWYLFHAGNRGVVGYKMEDPYTLQQPSKTINAVMDFWSEGPKMFKRNDIYYMVFTGDHWLSRGYRESYATAEDSPLGEFHMADNNPIAISTKDGFYGLGNGFVLRGPDLDSYYFLYHNLERLGSRKTRKLNIDRVVFNGKRMSVLGPTNFTQPMPTRPDFYTWLDESGLDGWETIASNAMHLVVSPKVSERHYTAEFNFCTAANDEGQIGVVFSYKDFGNYHYAVVDTKTAVLSAYRRQDGAFTRIGAADLPKDFLFNKLHTIRIENGSVLKVFFDEMKQLELPHASGGRIGYISQDVTPVMRFTAFSNKVNGSDAGLAPKPVPGGIESIHASATSAVTWNPYDPEASSNVKGLADGSFAVSLATGE